ncbi:hypothetical protein [Cellulomonas fengjieae]|uniref:EcsC family protein n=1 Tax=Cellulomonas fengjieae TaxID=2819978 RepID=A0ABS3SLK4_9CELL|nr:hypothetical protein [Cellulomonas fengjieae]MBO3086638.1 hypothetical protein [Cellulomonas fengjieae]QVI66513.1 hypothetical protein KG102_02580 [Cellulomonas fengjieae]
MPSLVEAALAKAVTIPSSTIHAHVDSVRSRNPEATPEQIVRILEKEYLRVVQATGGAVGATAAAPAVGTGVAFMLTASDVATFFGASAAFALAVASVHGIEVEDTERRRGLLLTTILGDSGGKIVTGGAELTSVSVARALLTRMPLATVRKVNTSMTRRFVRTQLTKQAGLAVGRLIPFGVGLIVGVTGARALGKDVIEGARKAFGPAPLAFPKVLEVAGPGGAPMLVPAAPPRPTGRLKRLGRKTP